MNNIPKKSVQIGWNYINLFANKKVRDLVFCRMIETRMDYWVFLNVS